MVLTLGALLVWGLIANMTSCRFVGPFLLERQDILLYFVK